jgi:hypothetical protein
LLWSEEIDSSGAMLECKCSVLSECRTLDAIEVKTMQILAESDARCRSSKETRDMVFKKRDFEYGIRLNLKVTVTNAMRRRDEVREKEKR